MFDVKFSFCSLRRSGNSTPWGRGDIFVSIRLDADLVPDPAASALGLGVGSCWGLAEEPSPWPPHLWFPWSLLHLHTQQKACCVLHLITLDWTSRALLGALLPVLAFFAVIEDSE